MSSKTAELSVKGKEKADKMVSEGKTKPSESPAKKPKGEEVWEELEKELPSKKSGKSKGLTPAQEQKILEEAKAVDTVESVSGNYRLNFKKLHPDFPGGKQWQVHHSIPQKFRQILKDAGIDVNNSKFLRGARTTAGELKNVHAKITTHWENWHSAFKKQYGREPNAIEIIEKAKEVDFRFGHVYWEAEKAAGIPVPVSAP